jgi:hypothetical protein
MSFKVGQVTLNAKQTMFNMGVYWATDKGPVYVAPTAPALGTTLRFYDFRRFYQINPAQFWYTFTVTNEGNSYTLFNFEGSVLP